MNDPNTPQSQTQLGNWFADAPGGDSDLDQLFPNPEGQPQATPVPQAPQTPAAPEWFLESSTGTKYKSKEDAIKGIADKDQYIAKLRQELEEVKKPAVAEKPAPDPMEAAFDDLVAAANKGDKRGYMNKLAEIQLANLAPYAPLLGEVARERALRAAEAETHGVYDFAGSAEMSVYLENRPTLRQAIELASRNPQVPQEQLKELYQIAYEAALGRKAPDLVRNAAVAVAPPVPTRPTLTTSTPTLSPAGTNPAQASLYSHEGRRAIIDRAEQRGVDKTAWGDVKL
jgi:hypothetical protein